jgi:hypothetical protein
MYLKKLVEVSNCNDLKNLIYLYNFWGETEATWYVGHGLAFVPAPDDR